MKRHDKFKRERRPHGLTTHKDVEILLEAARPIKVIHGVYRYRGFVFIRQSILKEFGWKNIRKPFQWRVLRSENFDLDVQTRGAVRKTLFDCMTWVKKKDGKPTVSKRPYLGGKFLPSHDTVMWERISRINRHYDEDDLDLE